MANAWQYSPARRIAMQIVMWVILGLTMLLASVVSSHRRRALELGLTPQTPVRGIAVSVPRNWEITRGRDELAPTLLTADEPDGDARNLSILLYPLPTRATPLQVALRGTDRRGRQNIAQQPITFAKSLPGVLVTFQQKIDLRSIGDIESLDASAKCVCAATVLPSGRALVINLVGFGDVDPSDADLVRRMVASVEVTGEPALRPAASIDLPDGIRLTKVPDGFELVQPDDPQSTDRVLRYRGESSWREVRLIPAIFLEKDRAASIQTMLSTIDPAWADSIVKEVSPGKWQIDRDDVASSPSTMMAMRAYLRADPGGAALLAIFSGGADAAWIDPAWQEISANVDFPPKEAMDGMLAAGAREASRLSEQGLAKLLPSARDDAWWLLYVDTPQKPLGWIHQSPAANGGKFEVRLNFPEEHTEQIVCEFTSGADLTTYRASLDYQIALERPHGTPEFDRYLAFAARLKERQLDLTVKPHDGATTTVQVPAPSQYVPGALLWEILGRLSVDEPMILRTDLAIDSLNARPTSPLTLIVRPEPNPPRAADSENSSLRCISVELAGSGAMTRWYFKPDETLESADFTQHVRQVRREQADISLDFARAPTMKP